MRPGQSPPPQATLDLDVALWTDLAFGAVAGVVAIVRAVLALRRPSVPPLTQGATVGAFGLAIVATFLLVAWGPSAYAPGTFCPSCTAYAGQSQFTDWSWTAGAGTIFVAVAGASFAVALVLQVISAPDPSRWAARLGATGIVAGIALFSLVFGDNWQAWYPFGSPYLLLWVLIVAVPAMSTALALRAIRRRGRSAAEPNA